MFNIDNSIQPNHPNPTETQVYEKGENVFIAGSWVSCLYITATGHYAYIEGTARDLMFAAEKSSGVFRCMDGL